MSCATGAWWLEARHHKRSIFKGHSGISAAIGCLCRRRVPVDSSSLRLVAKARRYVLPYLTTSVGN
eukprot:scaffold105082_cov30-Tisochrysis_lutea.AAC.4